MKSSLESKTIRPGLMTYSFYRSDRHPFSGGQKKKVAKPIALHWPKALSPLRVLVLLLIAAGLFALFNRSQTPNTGGAPAVGAAVVDKVNHCRGNSLDKHIIVSISERHAWACQASRTVYNSPVITGMEKYDTTRTPVGTYHIYAKQTSVTLSGSDAAGSWNDPVYYWMPFLDNQHGTYGFHDATWRADNQFGAIDPNSSDASHGCVELPLAASKWLYEWASVGTTVTIES